MPRKVIIDCDMGIDDAVAICMLLFDKRFEVVAITAVEGCVAADQANSNLHAIISELDPDRYPRLGIAKGADDAPAVDTRFLYGDDGLGNAGFEGTQRQNPDFAEKLIIDTVRAYPDEVTILCLGPLTNLARAIQREPTLVSQIDQVIINGGSLDGKGNITPCAEFNFYFDPASAQKVLQSRMTKILVPLSVTQQIEFGLKLIEDLPGNDTRAGHFLRQILPPYFRASRQQLGLESVTLNDAIGALALVESQLFQYTSLGVAVETEGELTRGMLVVDQRVQPEMRPNVNAATGVRNEQLKQYLLDQLTLAGNATN